MANDFFKICPYTWRMSFVPKFEQEVLRVNPNYIGKVVFMQAPDSGYGSGEYVIVEQSPNMLFGVQTGGGYGSHEIKSMPYAGAEKAWKVLRVTDDPEYLERFCAAQRKFAAEINAPKKHWCESVYHGATRVADNIERLLRERKTQDKPVAGDRKITGPSVKDTLTLCISRDVKHLSIDIVE